MRVFSPYPNVETILLTNSGLWSWNNKDAASIEVTVVEKRIVSKGLIQFAVAQLGVVLFLALDSHSRLILGAYIIFFQLDHDGRFWLLKSPGLLLSRRVSQPLVEDCPSLVVFLHDETHSRGVDVHFPPRLRKAFAFLNDQPNQSHPFLTNCRQYLHGNLGVASFPQRIRVVRCHLLVLYYSDFRFELKSRSEPTYRGPEEPRILQDSPFSTPTSCFFNTKNDKTVIRQRSPCSSD